MTKDQLLELVLRGLPYSNQIKNIDTQSESQAIRFDWRGTRYRIYTIGEYGLDVEEVGNGVLIGSDQAILMRSLLEVYKQASETNTTK